MKLLRNTLNIVDIVIEKRDFHRILNGVVLVVDITKHWNLNECLQEEKTRLEIRQMKIRKKKNTFIRLFTVPLRLFPLYDSNHTGVIFDKLLLIY